MRNPDHLISTSAARSVAAALFLLLSLLYAHAAAPGIKGPAFALIARDSYISQPNGQAGQHNCNMLISGAACA